MAPFEEVRGERMTERVTWNLTLLRGGIHCVLNDALVQMMPEFQSCFTVSPS
jgi:hypothetical protein